VLNPDSPTQVCWLWAQYATVTGDWQSLPVATQPPTPTPPAGFTVKYLGVVSCPPNNSLRLEITNIGPITFRSIKVDMTDSDGGGATKTHTGDNFSDYTGCLATTTWIDLEPNEVGISVTTNPGSFSYNITGHNLTVTITLFSQDGLAGESATKTISVTP
jgi:hypothetical protein